MPEDLPDLGQPRALAEQVAGHRVAEPVGSELGQPGPMAGAVHRAQHMRAVQPGIGGMQDDQQRASRAAGPAMLHVVGQRLTDIGRKRQAFPAASLAAHQQLTGPPVDIAQLDRRHLARAQAQPRQQHQDRVIAATASAAAITAGQ